eukprot:scaffold6650_cov65-Phaeocystis_antarctica.AAC.1
MTRRCPRRSTTRSLSSTDGLVCARLGLEPHTSRRQTGLPQTNRRQAGHLATHTLEPRLGQT